MTPLKSRFRPKLSRQRPNLWLVLFGGFAFSLMGCDSPAVVPAAVPTAGSADTASATEKDTIEVEISVTGFDGAKGKCRVAAYLSPKGFNDPEQAIAREVLAIEGDTVRWTFSCPLSDDPATPVRLAISAFQDRNDNASLDKNVLGIPTERYGFSNNPKRGYGPPKFEQAVVLQPISASTNEAWVIPITIQ